jgi:hypothetical protein
MFQNFKTTKEKAVSFYSIASPKVNALLKKASSSSVDPDAPWLEKAQNTLTELASSILQSSPKDISLLKDAIIAKGAGASGAAGIMGLISAFGSASTGTAISSLTGAAASTAKLYWVGSLVGGGVAAGGGVLLAAAVGLGWIGSRAWKGKPRTKKDLIDEELRLLSSVECLLPAIHEVIETKRKISSQELVFLKKFWDDLIHEAKEYERKTGSNLMAPKHRMRFGASVKELKKLNETIDEITNNT